MNRKKWKTKVKTKPVYTGKWPKVPSNYEEEIQKAIKILRDLKAER